MEGGGGRGGGAAPTGCYKCGRPGHWSRDCPSNPNSNFPSNTNNNNDSNKTARYASKATGGGASKPAEKPKKVPRTRPKLTPESLLSNDGLGYILRYFPRSFKYRGRGHEVSDLGNLLGLYAEWHSHLIPYYSFDQFVHKVEQVGATKRVRLCIKELRERVANGGDPTKLHERPAQHDTPNYMQDTMNLEDLTSFPENMSLNNHEVDALKEDMFHEIYDKETEEPAQNLHGEIAANIASGEGIAKELPNLAGDDTHSNLGEGHISSGLRARMAANRLKALERAAARAQLRAT